MKKLPKTITQEEFEKLFKAAQKVRGYKKKRQYMVAMLLGFESGMRISEVVGLDDKIPPLTPDRVEQTSIRIEQGKGKKDRIVPRPKRLTEPAVKLLPLKVERRALQYFISNLGKRVLNKKISFHTLRHGFATHFNNHTGDIRTLQVLLGHSRLDTTSIYAHVDPKKAIEKAREVF